MTDELDKTIPPQRAGDNDYFRQMEMREAITEKGYRERKADGHFLVGDLIMRRYKVLSKLGQGGMGVVYKCFDETAGIEVALKALPPELSHNTLEMEDIKENFQLVHNLHHPNIASSNTLEKNPENGNYYLIMECCEGEDLRRWIKRKRKDNPLTLNDVLPVIRQVADALDYAHAQKIIHRDIKPGNIMIDSAGSVKVLDFGLAAQIHTSMTRVSMAYHGTSGTGPYMAPEQWRGRAQGAAADQYALAVMAYEILAGSLPFASSDPAVLQQAVLTQQADPIEGLPEHAQNALDRALSKDPAARFNSCADFAAALGGEFVAAPQRVEADTPDPANANDPKQEDPLLTRASLFWESGDFRSAKEYCERVLDRDPKNGEAYFIRLLAELKLKKQDDLLNASKLDRNQTFLLALKFAGPERKQELETLLQKWKDKAREKARARAKILKRIGVITGICVLICLLAGGFFAYEVWQDHKAVEALKKAAEAEARAKAEAEERKIKEEPTKTIYLDNGVSLTMIGVAPGSFMMGSEKNGYSGEVVYRVTLTQAYYLGETEVTQAQWQAVMHGEKSTDNSRDLTNPSHFQGDNRPVECVSWNEAMAFCQKLNDEGRAPRGWKFTLPTDAQWEYAARGGNKSKGYKYSGSNDVDDVAWYDENSGKETHAVRQKRANELGLYDMSGNVWEWCLDWYRYAGYDAKEVKDPQGPQSGSHRVLRGGGWYNYARRCRSAVRGSSSPDDRSMYFGFRLALVPVQ